MNLRPFNPMLCTLLGGLAIATLAVAQKPKPQQVPKYNVQVNLVSLDVEVLDSYKNPVLGLRQKDLLVKENGRPMEISNFAWMADRPVSLAMVLDTSAVSVQGLVTFKRFLRELASDLPRSDILCLYSFDNRDAYLEMDFTSDRMQLWDALDNIAVPSGRSDGILREMFSVDPPIGLAIDRAAHRLEKTDHGKKALLLVSNRFRGLGPATVEHIQQSGCTFLTLGAGSKSALVITLGGDWINKQQLMKQSGGRQFPADERGIAGVCHAMAYSLKNYYAVGYLTEMSPDEKKPRHIEVGVPGRHYTINYRRSVSLVTGPGLERMP